MSCKCNSNPCHCACPTNTAQCETLPSQIENFTKQFFGVVTKTEVNGVVTWSLPCDLDTGLENNPRLPDEGLACYFKRLFEQGIIGLTGPEGDTGDNGEDGNNAYTVTLSSYAQPSGANPNVQVFTAFNPAIFEGLTVFIQTSGYYFVNATDGNGTLFLTLIQATAGAPAVITAGKLVVSTGPQGTGPQGERGIQGETGSQGNPGQSFTVTNGQFHAAPGNDYSTQIIYATVTFGGDSAEVPLPTQGKYALTAVVAFLGKPGIVLGDTLSLKLRDAVLGDVDGSEQLKDNVVSGEVGSVTLHALFETDSDNHLIRLTAKSTTNAVFDIVSDRTIITFIRIA